MTSRSTRGAAPPAGYSGTPLPKKLGIAAGDLDENGVRELALPLGLVDVKVCAIDADWSGLLLMWRKVRRATPPK